MAKPSQGNRSADFPALVRGLAVGDRPDMVTSVLNLLRGVPVAKYHANTNDGHKYLKQVQERHMGPVPIRIGAIEPPCSDDAKKRKSKATEDASASCFYFFNVNKTAATTHGTTTYGKEYDAEDFEEQQEDRVSVAPPTTGALTNITTIGHPVAIAK